jgi:hypothetical protein
MNWWYGVTSVSEYQGSRNMNEPDNEIEEVTCIVCGVEQDRTVCDACDAEDS